MGHIATQVNAVESSQLEADLEDIDAGVLKDLAVLGTLTLNGAVMTPAQIDAQLKAYLATIQAANAAKQQYQAALVARRNQQVEARNFYLQLKRAVIAGFGPQAAELADFGLSPAKARPPKTSAQLALTAAKVQLTRKARGTTSKKQKQQINPGLGTPAVVIGADGKLQAVAPVVSDGAVPGRDAEGSASQLGGDAAAAAT